MDTLLNRSPDGNAQNRPNTPGHETQRGRNWFDWSWLFSQDDAGNEKGRLKDGPNVVTEVLLLLAEALDEQGKSAEALPYLNQVRDRAELDDIVSTANLRDVIFDERRVELAFENKRWLDLVRTDRAADVMSTFGANVKANPADYYFPPGQQPVPAAFTQIDLTFPLPADEALLSPFF